MCGHHTAVRPGPVPTVNALPRRARLLIGQAELLWFVCAGCSAGAAGSRRGVGQQNPRHPCGASALPRDSSRVAVTPRRFLTPLSKCAHYSGLRVSSWFRWTVGNLPGGAAGDEYGSLWRYTPFQCIPGLFRRSPGGVSPARDERMSDGSASPVRCPGLPMRSLPGFCNVTATGSPTECASSAARSYPL